MSEETKEVVAEESTDNTSLEGLTIGQLRKYASLYRIPLNKEATKLEILAAIKHKLKNKQVTVVTDESKGPAPGRTRIVIQKDASLGPRAGGRPVPVFVNGYRAEIPRGVPCDVPHKVVSLLENSEHPQCVEDPEENGRYKIELLPSYPFSILATTPGPDPSPGFEKVKQQTHRPREAFYQMFDYWPSKEKLREAIKEGLITLKRGEQLPGEARPIKEE